MQFTFASTLLDIINQPGLENDMVASLKEATPANLDVFHVTAPWAKLRSAMFESIRLSGPISGPARLVMQDTTLASDESVHVPKGQVATMSAYYTQRDRDLWGDTAENYVPERFVAGDPPIGTPSYIIWGLQGPHMCPGRWFGQAMIQVMTMNILRSYTFKPEAVLEDGEKYEYGGGMLKRRPVAVAVSPRVARV